MGRARRDDRMDFSAVPESPIPERRAFMQAQRRGDTGPELSLRRALHSRGLRYRLHQRIVPGSPGRSVDVVFPGPKVAVDVRGCFWHVCPTHATRPKANAEWWSEKLRRNVERDADTAERLAAEGWELVVVWEHDDPAAAAERIAQVVRSRRKGVDRNRPSADAR